MKDRRARFSTGLKQIDITFFEAQDQWWQLLLWIPHCRVFDFYVLNLFQDGSCC